MSSIDIPYAVVLDLPPNLQDTVEEAFHDYQDLKSRRQIENWEGRWWSYWSSNVEMAASILDWIRQMTWLGSDVLTDVGQVSEIFLTLLRLRDSGHEGFVKAAEELGQFQVLMMKKSYKHRNVVSELDQAYDVPFDTVDMAEEDGSDISLAFEDQLPTGDPLYQECLEKCNRWNFSLKAIFLDTKTPAFTLDEGNIQFTAVRAVVVSLFREMRALPRKIYRRPEWERAVILSGLYLSIEIICDPAYLVRYPQPYGPGLMRFYTFSTTLGRILEQWTPVQIVDSWCGQETPFVPTKNGRKRMESGTHFIQVMKTLPHLLQLEAYPQFIFFLLSERNFTFAWNRWLGPHLDNTGYNLLCIKSLPLFYGDIKRSILRLSSRHNNKGVYDIDSLVLLPKQEHVRLVLKRTIRYWKMAERVNDNAFEFKGNRIPVTPNSSPSDSAGIKTGQCTKCHKLPMDQQCVQEVSVSLNSDTDFVKKVQGTGISKVPKEEQMRPVPARKKGKTRTPIYHPDDLGLFCIRSSAQVKKNCGRQVFKIMDHKTNEMIDFIIFNAFDTVTLQSLIEHTL